MNLMELLTCGTRDERDYYEVLNVAPNASADEIKEAYRRVAFQCHPDRHQETDEANRRMQQVNEAYAVLSDPIQRREYDLPRGYGRQLAKFRKGCQVAVSASSPSPYRGHTGLVDKEPVRDAFRFWYMVKIESRGLTTVRRFAEEELEKPRNQ
jgi:curved DNA-binding protein CbpA